MPKLDSLGVSGENMCTQVRQIALLKYIFITRVLSEQLNEYLTDQINNR